MHPLVPRPGQGKQARKKHKADREAPAAGNRDAIASAVALITARHTRSGDPLAGILGDAEPDGGILALTMLASTFRQDRRLD